MRCKKVEALYPALHKREKGKLLAYRWSSLPSYVKGRGAEWLELRAKDGKGKLSDEAMRALRKGWYLGEDSFKDKLLDLVEKSSAKLKKKGSHSGAAMSEHGEKEAEKIFQAWVAMMIGKVNKN